MGENRKKRRGVGHRQGLIDGISVTSILSSTNWRMGLLHRTFKIKLFTFKLKRNKENEMWRALIRDFYPKLRRKKRSKKFPSFD